MVGVRGVEVVGVVGAVASVGLDVVRQTMAWVKVSCLFFRTLVGFLERLVCTK